MLQGSSHIGVPLSFLSVALSCFFILLLWQLKEKALIKILQVVTFEIRAILGATTWSKNCC